MKLYLVRHGQTDWNIDHRVQGRTDIPLNATGIGQAEALRDKIKDLKFDACYSSPLVRAIDTAKIITGGRYEIVTDELITERCFGELEGREAPPDWHNYWVLNHSCESIGMESLPDVFLRTKKFLDRVKDEYGEDSSILVVGHGGSLKTLHFNIVGYDVKTDFMSVRFENGELWEYEV